MRALLTRHRIAATWSALVVATLLSWLLGRDDSNGSEAVGAAILLLAFVKVRFVLTGFMELRSAPPALARSFDLWCIAACTALIALHLALGPV